MSFFVNCFSQVKIINNQIQTVGSITVDKRATVNFSIAKIVVNQTIETKLYFIKSTQEKDKSGYYITSIYVGNKDRLPYFGADLRVDFDNPIDSAGQSGFSSALGLEFGITGPKTYIFKASQINRYINSTLVAVFFFKSKEKISFTITGLDGNLPIE